MLDRRHLLTLGGGAALLALAPRALAAPATAAAPPAPPAWMRRLLGEYGPADAQLVIYEDGGALLADGRGLAAARLAGRGTRFAAGDHNLIFGATAVTLDGTAIARRDIGAEVQARVRAAVNADFEALRRAAQAATPPQEPTPARAAELVPLTGRGMSFNITYATDHNFMGRPIYERAGAFLQRPAAEAVGRALERLRAQGFGLVIYDGYRPWFATKMFWEATPPENRVFVADPSKGSRHNRGCAIDLGLTELATGRVIEMPSRYDEFSRRSYADYSGGTTRQRWHRKILRDAMEAEGFIIYPEEWWHFDYHDWQSYGIGTASYSELMARR